jgi:hypothetical protein
VFDLIVVERILWDESQILFFYAKRQSLVILRPSLNGFFKVLQSLWVATLFLPCQQKEREG